jgi:hypothetical protein
LVCYCLVGAAGDGDGNDDDEAQSSGDDDEARPSQRRRIEVLVEDDNEAAGCLSFPVFTALRPPPAPPSGHGTFLDLAAAQLRAVTADRDRLLAQLQQRSAENSDGVRREPRPPPWGGAHQQPAAAAACPRPPSLS